MFTEAQIHRDVSQATYHDWPRNQQTERGKPDWVLSRSELLQMEDSGERFLAGGREVSGSSIDFGSVVDCLLTEPREFGDRYAVQPATYEKLVISGRGVAKTSQFKEMPWNNNSNTCKAWAAEQRDAGREVVSFKIYREAQDAAQVVLRKQPELPECRTTLGQLFDLCACQLVVTATWHDDQTGLDIPCRAMLDFAWLGEHPQIWDLKTAQEANRKKFGYSIKDYGYDVQAWMYPEMLRAAIGCDQIPFGFIVVRNSRPYLVATYRAKADTIRSGEWRFRTAMSDYCDALERGHFRGYTEGFEEI